MLWRCGPTITSYAFTLLKYLLNRSLLELNYKKMFSYEPRSWASFITSSQLRSPLHAVCDKIVRWSSWTSALQHSDIRIPNSPHQSSFTSPSQLFLLDLSLKIFCTKASLMSAFLYLCSFVMSKTILNMKCRSQALTMHVCPSVSF